VICRTKSGTRTNRQQATWRQKRHGSRQTCATNAVKCRSDFVMDALNNGKQVQCVAKCIGIMCWHSRTPEIIIIVIIIINEND